MLDEKLITGIEKLDKQHEVVLSSINDIKEAIDKSLSKERIIELVDSLDFYANEHFDYEESLAELCNFCRMDEFKDAHNDFRNQYKLIRKFYGPKIQTTPRIYALLLVSVLEGWLHFHFIHIEYEVMAELKKCIAKGLDISKAEIKDLNS